MLRVCVYTVGVTRQDKSKPGRVTPKGTTGADSTSVDGDAMASSGVSRVPVRLRSRLSILVPVVMFGALGLGTLLIIVNYMGLFGDTRQSLLWAGLGLVLVGITASTRLR